MTDWKIHIESKAEVLFGKPVIAKTRIPVDLILEKLAEGDSIEDLLSAYPAISREDISSCLLFGADAVKNEKVITWAV